MEHRIFLVEDDRSLADAICAQMKLWALDCVCAADFRAVMAEFARDVSTNVVFMADGVICEEGRPKDIFENPQNPKTREFLSRFLVG